MVLSLVACIVVILGIHCVTDLYRRICDVIGARTLDAVGGVELGILMSDGNIWKLSFSGETLHWLPIVCVISLSLFLPILIAMEVKG